MDFDFWQDAVDNLAKDKRDKMRKLLLKYGDSLNEDEIDEADWFDYQSAKAYEQEVRQEMSVGQMWDQVSGAVGDLYRNYLDMKRDRTKFADDYFHCKANFEAAQRGKYGAITAKYLGDTKEAFDYFKNRVYNGLSPVEAYADYLHDKDVNLQGRHQAQTGLYKNSKDACRYHRVRGINEKY